MTTLPRDCLPDRIVLRMLTTGVEAITADILADILYTLDGDELAIVQAEWASRPPVVRMGYARIGAQFPCFAITLISDSPDQDYMAFSEQALYDDDDEIDGNQFAQRTQATFGIWVYAEHPDLCLFYYRILRRIMNVGKTHLITNGLGEPLIRGAEMAPAPYLPENLYARRLDLTVSYLEGWSDQDPLWTALNGAAEERGSTVDVRHEETVVEQVRGEVSPYFDEDEDEEEEDE